MGYYCLNVSNTSVRQHIFSLSGQSPGGAIVLPPVSALALAAASVLMLKFLC